MLQRFLKFRTRSYFTEVSNQIQGRELFTLEDRSLGYRVTTALAFSPDGARLATAGEDLTFPPVMMLLHRGPHVFGVPEQLVVPAAEKA